MRGWLAWLNAAGWLDRAEIAQRFEFAGAPPALLRARPLYVALGVLWCAMCVGPMTAAEAGGIAAGVAFLVGMPGHWRTLGAAFRQPVFLLLVAWGAWGAITLAWTTDVAKGTWELSSLRFVWSLPVLWTLMPRRRLLIAGVCAGFLASNLSQVALAAVRHVGWTHLDFASAYPDRNAGWWSHPAISGYMLVAGLGLHLPAAMMGRGRERWVGVAGAFVTWLGLFATGTRGAWLGGGALMMVVGAVALWRWARGPRRVRPTRNGLVMAAVAGLAILMGIGVVWPTIARRFEETREEVRRVLVDRDMTTYSGSRVQFALWAMEMWRERPIEGHGAGSYEAWVRAKLDREGGTEKVDHIGPQAHNLVLHAGATLGAVGVLIMAGLIWFVLRGGVDGLPRDERGRADLGTYDAGPGCAVLGLLMCAPFEVAYVHTPPSALLSVLIPLCFFARPPAGR